MALRRVLAWVLLFALVAAQTLGLMHRVVHGPGFETEADIASVHAHHEDHPSHSWTESLFGGHEGEPACRLFDQLSQGGCLPSVPAVLLPVERDADGELLPEFAYRQVRANFHGLEAGGNVRLHEGGSTWDLELRGDAVRATNADTGQPLPRIAPWRAGATLAWAQGAWGARLGFDHFARQDRVPAGELATGAYDLWTAALTYRMNVAASTLLWYARLDNAGNRRAYSATSILTQTAPGKAPLPGRSLKVGLQASF